MLLLGPDSKDGKAGNEIGIRKEERKKGVRS
jgi:hypothetical protein